MITLSVFAGTEAPGAPPEVDDHVEVDDHGPDATAYLSAEKPSTAHKATIVVTNNATANGRQIVLVHPSENR